MKKFALFAMLICAGILNLGCAEKPKVKPADGDKAPATKPADGDKAPETPPTEPAK